MKWLYVLGCVALISVASVRATEEEEFEEDGDARLGYITVTGGGGTTLAFNATSIQNAVILGLFLLVLGALLLPLLGLNLFGDSGDSGYGYSSGSGSGYGQESGYAAPSDGYGHGFAKRSVAMLGPVLEALSQSEKKYQ